jgi:hypothetical protein
MREKQSGEDSRRMTVGVFSLHRSLPCPSNYKVNALNSLKQNQEINKKKGLAEIPLGK